MLDHCGVRRSQLMAGTDSSTSIKFTIGYQWSAITGFPHCRPRPVRLVTGSRYCPSATSLMSLLSPAKVLRLVLRLVLKLLIIADQS